MTLSPQRREQLRQEALECLRQDWASNPSAFAKWESVAAYLDSVATDIRRVNREQQAKKFVVSA